MSKKSTSRDSQTDWERIDRMRDEDIDLSDIPEITQEQMSQATLRFGGKPVPQGKVRVNMLLDSEVIAYFKSQAGDREYQTLINEALKASIRDRDFETTLRRIIQEELHRVR
ncbi:MAG: BrnA antitoxin family protein [bacterium]